MVPLLNVIGAIVFVTGVILWFALLTSGLACWRVEQRPPDEPDSRPAPKQDQGQPAP